MESTTGIATPGPTKAMPLTWSEAFEAVAGGGDPAVVAGPQGERLILLSESQYHRLQSSARVDNHPGIPLSSRELEILQMIAEGTAGSVVAQRLGLAPNTVAQHLASVRRKYGVRSSAAAAASARAAGLIN